MSRCPRCKAQKEVGRRHTPREWGKYRLLKGHGYLKERGWTDPEAEHQHGLWKWNRRRRSSACSSDVRLVSTSGWVFSGTNKSGGCTCFRCQCSDCELTKREPAGVKV